MSISNDSPSSDIAPETISAFQRALLGWWEGNARDLPWRQTRDPYRILVSEVMLQQTQVDRVIPYFHRWLEAFPDIHALAAAPTSEVIRIWKGLGYNRRAVNLHRAATAVKDRGGTFPDTVEGLLALPGIGPYTAGAIACFAFERDVAFIDTNMRRVLHRVFVGSEVPVQLANYREVTAIAASVIPPGKGWRWNQALIEFGALQCTARTPACVICPAQSQCRARPSIHSDIATAAAARKGRKPGVPFERTNRYYRGRIIDALREHVGAPLPIEVLGPMIKPDYASDDRPWLTRLLLDLDQDGLAAIADDEPEYDGNRDSSIRVSLP
jgi:A/G-specific adenine glycosylase